MATDYDALEKLFHEPNRLAIMSELCGRAEGAAFTDLKKACGLTDGNLSRHLKTLQSAGVVKINKSFVAEKPRTTISATVRGRKQFLDYLSALEAVLKEAAKRARSLQKSEKPAGATLQKAKTSKS